MKSVSVSDLKARLSEYLRRVRAGEQLLVTDRGTPIATLVPLPPMDDDLRDLIEAGKIRPPRGKLPDDFWDLPRPKDPEEYVLKALLEERESGW